MGAEERIGPALTASVDGLQAWAWGQNAQSRDAPPGIVTDAVPLPRFPLIALTASKIHFFDSAEVERATKAAERVAPIASVGRAAAQVDVKGGPMWKCVTIVDPGSEASYIVYLNKVVGGRRVGETIAALRAGASIA